MDNPPPVSPGTQPVTTLPLSTIPASPPLPPSKSNSKWKKILLIIFGLFLLGGGLLGFLIYQGVKDAPQVQQEITTFLTTVSEGKYENAYSQTSSKFKEATSYEDFVKAMGLFKAQYSGFKEVSQTGFNIESNAGQPTVYSYSGTVMYDDGDQGQVAANLIKEDKEWKIISININVTIDRLEKFEQGSKDAVLGVSSQK